MPKKSAKYQYDENADPEAAEKSAKYQYDENADPEAAEKSAKYPYDRNADLKVPKKYIYCNCYYYKDVHLQSRIL